MTFNLLYASIALSGKYKFFNNFFALFNFNIEINTRIKTTFLISTAVFINCESESVTTFWFYFQHVDEENSYLCGYLQINGLTDEYPTLTTFFDGEIISQKYPFLTRKWDADEDVDKKHWVRIYHLDALVFINAIFFRVNFRLFANILRLLIRTRLTTRH